MLPKQSGKDNFLSFRTGNLSLCADMLLLLLLLDDASGRIRSSEAWSGKWWNSQSRVHRKYEIRARKEKKKKIKQKRRWREKIKLDRIWFPSSSSLCDFQIFHFVIPKKQKHIPANNNDSQNSTGKVYRSLHFFHSLFQMKRMWTHTTEKTAQVQEKVLKVHGLNWSHVILPSSSSLSALSVYDPLIPMCFGGFFAWNKLSSLSLVPFAGRWN